MIARTSVSDWMSVGQVCQEFSLSAPTVRNLLDNNPDLCFRSVGSHRRASRRKLSDFLGITSPVGANGQSTVPLALVCRVSGSNQARKSSPTAECSSLDHQIKRVEDFAKEKFGESAFASAVKYYRIGGGLNHNHPSLVQLVSDILNGKFRKGYIVCQDSIRLMRFGEGLFTQICKFGECEIVYAMEIDRSDAEVDLSESILQILCHFTAKASGMRAKKILEICVTEDDLVKIYKMYKEGMSYADVAKWAKSQGIVGTKGQALGAAKIHQLLTKHYEVLDKLVPEETNMLEDFIKNHIQKKDKAVVKQMDIYQRYASWCNENGTVPVSERKLGMAIRAAGVESVKSHGGCKCYRGVALRNN